MWLRGAMLRRKRASSAVRKASAIGTEAEPDLQSNTVEWAFEQVCVLAANLTLTEPQEVKCVSVD